MRTLGLIGGTSWFSTTVYYRHLNEMVAERLGKPENPPLLLNSLNVAVMRRGDWEEIGQTFLQAAVTLQRAGAEALMICANTPHKVIPFVQPKLDIPFLHIADATAGEARQLGLDALGLLGTLPVLEELFIIERLTAHDLSVLTPERRERIQLQMAIAEELTQGIFTGQTKAFLLDEMVKLRSKGANGIVLGCTELPLIIEPADFALPLLDTTRLHAAQGVDFILQ